MKRLERFLGFWGIDKKFSVAIARGAIGMPHGARHDRILASLGTGVVAWD